jgi:ribosomal protein S11
VGFKNAKKGSNVAAQTAAMDVAQVIEKYLCYR